MNTYDSHPKIVAMRESEEERARVRAQLGLGAIIGLVLLGAANILTPWVLPKASEMMERYNAVTGRAEAAPSTFIEWLLTIPDLPAPAGFWWTVLTISVFALCPFMAWWSLHIVTIGWHNKPLSREGKIGAYLGIATAATVTLITILASYTHVRAVIIAGGYEPPLATVVGGVLDGWTIAMSVLWFFFRPSSSSELREERDRIVREIEAEEAAARQQAHEEELRLREREHAEAARREELEYEENLRRIEREHRAQQLREELEAAERIARAEHEQREKALVEELEAERELHRIKVETELAAARAASAPTAPESASAPHAGTAQPAPSTALPRTEDTSRPAPETASTAALTAPETAPVEVPPHLMRVAEAFVASKGGRLKATAEQVARVLLFGARGHTNSQVAALAGVSASDDSIGRWRAQALEIAQRLDIDILSESPDDAPNGDPDAAPDTAPDGEPDTSSVPAA